MRAELSLSGTGPQPSREAGGESAQSALLVMTHAARRRAAVRPRRQVAYARRAGGAQLHGPDHGLCQPTGLVRPKKAVLEAEVLGPPLRPLGKARDGVVRKVGLRDAAPLVAEHTRAPRRALLHPRIHFFRVGYAACIDARPPDAHCCHRLTA